MDRDTLVLFIVVALLGLCALGYMVASQHRLDILERKVIHLEYQFKSLE